MPIQKKKKRRTPRATLLHKEEEPKEDPIQPEQPKSSYQKSYEEYLKDLFEKTDQTTVTLRDWLNWTYLQTRGAISRIVIRKKRRLDWEHAQEFWTEYARMLGIQGTTPADGGLREHQHTTETARGYLNERQKRQTATRSKRRDTWKLHSRFWRSLAEQSKGSMAQREKQERIMDVVPSYTSPVDTIQEMLDTTPRPPESRDKAGRYISRTGDKTDELFGPPPTEGIKDRIPKDYSLCEAIEEETGLPVCPRGDYEARITSGRGDLDWLA